MVQWLIPRDVSMIRFMNLDWEKGIYIEILLIQHLTTLMSYVVPHQKPLLVKCIVHSLGNRGNLLMYHHYARLWFFLITNWGVVVLWSLPIHPASPCPRSIPTDSHRLWYSLCVLVLAGAQHEARSCYTLLAHIHSTAGRGETPSVVLASKRPKGIGNGDRKEKLRSAENINKRGKCRAIKGCWAE